jgi:hypothetical protein
VNVSRHVVAYACRVDHWLGVGVIVLPQDLNDKSKGERAQQSPPAHGPAALRRPAQCQAPTMPGADNDRQAQCQTLKMPGMHNARLSQ